MVGHDEVRACMIDALAITNDITPDEVSLVLTDIGDDNMLELDSKTAEFLLVAAEVVVGHKLPSPGTLDETQYATLGALVDLIMKEI